MRGKKRRNHKGPSAAKPQPKKTFGIGLLTAKGAKNAKKEPGISPAKHVLSKDEGAPRRKGKKKIFEFGVFALLRLNSGHALREDYPISKGFEPVRICASRANFEILQCKAGKKESELVGAGFKPALWAFNDSDRRVYAKQDSALRLVFSCDLGFAYGRWVAER